MTGGAVLCGGASRRMGTDKALVEVDGVAMAERVARALAAGGCHPVVFVGGDERRLAALGRPFHADRWPGGGPLGGVITAITSSGGGDVVVAACDLPYLDAATVTVLLDTAGRRGGDADVVVSATDRLQPMFAWWSRRTCALLEERWRAGTRALHEAIAGLRAVELYVDPAVLRNVNAPCDLG